MSFSTLPLKKIIKGSFIWLAAFFVTCIFVLPAQAKIVAEKSASFGVIKGVVRDEQGSPIADAAIAVFYAGTLKLLKQVRSAADGSFLARVIPGTYTVLAVAQGFNSMTVNDVQVERSAELNYGFKLERVGSGNTLPEKRIDRNSTKWRIMAAQNRRSIYQNQEGKSPIDENGVTKESTVEETVSAVSDEETNKRRGQSIAETYFANSTAGNYEGFNFATLQPVGENAEIIFAGQTGTKNFAPNRLETAFKTRLNENHQIRLGASVAKLGKIQNHENELGQVSFQALDEWKVKDGVILILGFDYSRFVGAGSDSAVSPRFGLQFDVDAKTRIRTSYTTQTEERDWSNVIELEDNAVAFREQNAPPVVAIENAKPKLNKRRRLEFGVERVLDNNSSIEATAFFDTVSGRGVGLINMPTGVLNAENFIPLTVSQQGSAQGIRVVYSRRFGKIFSVSGGYSYGRGQRLAPQTVSVPVNFFENALFQNFVGQLNTDLKTGTRIQTIFRLSPQATVFAIDPFQSRFAIYDPGLSIVVTQPLPTLGLPIRAEAIIDARNVLDFQTGVSGEQGTLQLDSQRRTLRGGISVRF
ncbi:MAG: carboxypeptidase regulatory-like domain-containing protein [Pyrinomonadaceae bacterium]